MVINAQGVAYIHTYIQCGRRLNRHPSQVGVWLDFDSLAPLFSTQSSPVRLLTRRLAKKLSVWEGKSAGFDTQPMQCHDTGREGPRT